MILDRLLDYDAWANQQTIDSLRAGATPRSTTLMAHIVAAEIVWISRILGEPQPIAVWPALSLEESAALASQLSGRWRLVLEKFGGEGITTQISYTNIKGEHHNDTVEQIILHVVMHSGYHRGQIASDLRASGKTPPATDFILAVRGGHVG